MLLPVRRFFSSVSYKVSDSAKLSFREKGYAVLPGFLSEEELKPIETIYNKFMAGEVPIPGKDFCDMSQTFEAIKGKHPNDWQIVNAMRKWVGTSFPQFIDLSLHHAPSSSSSLLF